MITEEVSIPNCQGCLDPIEEGSVVAFGESLFHTKCFVCDKCKKCMENKTNLLLLENGKPVCDNCSYNCTECNKIIRDEAIMTGENAYHSDCFKCISCKNKIEDLIFTQTKKGIYCSICYESRKASRKNKVKPTPLTELPSRPLIHDPPTPAISPSNSSGIPSDSLLSALSPITLSFFDSSSNDLLDNLSNSLGANLCLNFSPSSEDTTQYRISRASEILQSSLRTSSLKHVTEAYDDKDISNLDDSRLKKELSEARLSLKELEWDYKSLQKASQQALDEFNKIKEEYAKETIIKRQQEIIITTLLKSSNHGGLLSKKELDKLGKFRAQLENACNELIKYRDMLAIEIDRSVDKQKLGNFYQKGLKTQLTSMIQQRDLLISETRELKATRDEALCSLVKLTQVNSSPEEQSPATSPQIPNTARPRRISDAGSIICNVSSRNSFMGDQTPTLFRIKKKGSTMFSKLTSSNSSSSISNTNANTKLRLETSVSASSIPSLTTSPSIYGISSKYINGSSQNLTKKSGSTESNLSSTSMQGNHSFLPTSFIRPVKCGVCTDKMWGRSEYRCEGCGFLSHSKCLSQVPSACSSPSPVLSRSSFDLLPEFDNKSSPPLSKSSSIFETSLIERVEFEGRPVPLLVTKCIEAVEKRGLDYEGIYRKSGGAAQTKAIQLAFDQGDSVDLCNEDEFNDVCAITSALKQYFRELPNPLITFESYQELIDISIMDNNDARKLKKVNKILSKLPRAHQDTLYLLLKHLNKICESSSLNRMTIKSLSMVFAPTLMRHQDPSRDFLDISYKNAIVEYLLLNTSKLQCF
ncbi:hypothetical protein G6F60_002255 [Rhizopus arrhizus]|nr:hypothetical protein G6F61_001714 [Rhizopus arrhizus]KAG1407352.1 hypothetical protein G6F60_002255 [Rhizopus arrhizus]